MGDSKKHKCLDSTMSLEDHLEELRGRLLWASVGLLAATIIAFIFGAKIIHFIELPYLKVMGQARLQTLAPADGFISYVKISFVAGLIFSSPWVFYHVWMFVVAGLYPNEKKYTYFAVPFSAILFIAGALFFILVVAPLTLKFLIGFNKNFLSVESNFTFQKYISFTVHLMLVFGIAFQTPTAIFFLHRTGLVSIQALSNSRKYIILGIVIISAMVTPPDVVSQVTLAVPLYGLFELGILLCYLTSRSKTADK
jgi:sec-independent protein translocase protein TatC